MKAKVASSLVCLGNPSGKASGCRALPTRRVLGTLNHLSQADSRTHSRCLSHWLPGVLPASPSASTQALCPTPSDPTTVPPWIPFGSRVMFLSFFSHVPFVPAEAKIQWP